MISNKFYFKTVRILVLLLLPAFSFATNYYISNTGSDENEGTSVDRPWQTIVKVNKSFSEIKPGDTIFFKRGNIFYGSLIIGKSGMPDKPIVITAYDQGVNPVITGFTTLSGFIKKEAGIWQAPATLARRSLNVVLLNGQPQRMGRYPNADAADGGYLRYESFNANTSIMDNELPGNINWAGAEAVIRKNLWTVERCRVIKQEDKTITYTYALNRINGGNFPTMYNGTKGFGYFFQNDYRTLDETGEWFFDTTNSSLSMYFGKLDPAACTVKVSTVDTLMDTGNKKYISVSHITFEGANLCGIFNRYGSNISVQYCNFYYMGARAIQFWGTPEVLIDHVNTNYIFSSAIQVRNSKQQNNVTVSNCNLRNTGTLIGMGSFFEGMDYKALYVSVNDHAVIENNIIDTVGLSGIQFQGNNVVVKNNVVKHFCMQLDDGAGIYTWIEVEKQKQEANYVNRLIKDNIILYGMGNANGTTALPKAEGVYLDGGTMNVSVQNNTIAFVVNKAFACNNPENISFVNNTCYSNGGGWGAARTNAANELKNLVIHNNIFYSTSKNQVLVNFVYAGVRKPEPIAIWEAMQIFGNIDSNYYNILNPAAIRYAYSSEGGGVFTYPSPISYDKWKELARQDQHSKTDATLADISKVKFVYNEKDTPITVPLSGSYTGIDGTEYNGSILLKPFTSKILILK